MFLSGCVRIRYTPAQCCINRLRGLEILSNPCIGPSEMRRVSIIRLSLLNNGLNDGTCHKRLPQKVQLVVFL